MEMKKSIIFFAVAALAFMSCDRLYDSPVDDDRLNAGVGEEKPKYYMDQYDPVSDQGQYWHPDAMAGVPLPPSNYCFALFVGNANDNTLGGGLEEHLLAGSVAGVNQQIRKDFPEYSGVWFWHHAKNSYTPYKEYNARHATWGCSADTPLFNAAYQALPGGNFVNAIEKRYVLVDLANNPESGNVGVVASHVYNAYISDVSREQSFKDNGFTMAYDATGKTVADAFHEFKDECSNKALVVMPVHTGELADFAIANNLFVFNLNKEYGNPAAGQNTELFREILAWLEPNSPVYGWEVGVGEDEFVRPVSESGNMMIATSDYNIPFFSKDYRKEQKQTLANVINPQDIDYDKPGRFVSFYLSDGPHLGWHMTGLYEDYMSDPATSEVKMSFGTTISNLSQVSPAKSDFLMANQPKNSTYIESFGGGYWYSDDFGKAKNRPELLKSLAEKVGAHMRQHRIKVLEQIAHDPKSPEAMEAYQAFVDANDQLEGIIAIQYAPSYAAGGGEILWVTNKAGYDIPVITVRYSIWNMGDHNTERDGTPAFVAHKLNAEPESSKFSSVIVHAWSTFTDIEGADDELAENAAGGTLKGSSAAKACADRLDGDVNVVNTQELVWRVRMEYRPEQTMKYFTEYF